MNRPLEWNAGGWFGGQLGGTAWILIAAILSMAHDVTTGLTLLLLFLIPNMVGLLLWYQRKLTCYLSIQIVLALCGLFGLFAIYLLDRNHLWLKIQTGGAVSSEMGYFLLAVTVLVVMASFHLKFGRHANKPNA